MEAPNAFLGNFINPTNDRKLKILTDHLLTIDELGYVSYFGSSNSAPVHVLKTLDEKRVYKISPEGFVLPGFVDTHIHAPQYINAGNALDKPLKEWLESYTFAAEARIDADPNGLGQRVYTKLVQRLTAAGTTAASVFGTLSVEANMVLADAFQQGGVRGHIGKVNMDMNGLPSYIESTSDSLTRTEEFVTSLSSALSSIPEHLRVVEPVITPRFVPTCTPELLKGLASIAEKHRLRIQSHMSESIGQVEWSKSLFNGVEDIHVLDQTNLLTSRSLMAHCTHATSPHLELLSSRRTSIAHCPLSNLYFSPERSLPLRSALSAGVDVGLGSDISGGYEIGLETSMRMAVAISRQRAHSTEALEGEKPIEWREALWLATRGGAQAMGLNTGSFEEGKPFDAQLIELGSEGSRIDWFDVDERKKTSLESKLERWFHLGSEADRAGVWVQGRRLR